MAEWKQLLVVGDAATDNLGSADLTQTSSVRTYTVGSSKRLILSGGTVQFSDGSSVSHQFDNASGVFDARSANGIRLSDGDNDYHIDLKPKSELTGSYTITLPNGSPGAANKILESDANGNLTWIDTPSGGGGGVVATYTNGVDNRVITSSGSDSINGEASMTFDGTTLAVTGRISSTDYITLATNNRALKAQTTGASVVDIIKCNASNETEVGNSSEKTVLSGTSVDAGTLQFSCGPATMDQIIETNISLNHSSTSADHGDGSMVTYFDTSVSNNTTSGRVYYYTGTAWAFATSSAEAGNKALVGMALGDTEASGFLLRGFVNPGITMTAGSQCFLTTNASITNTVPTSGFSRVMGHSVTTTVMYFNPSADYIDL